MAETPLQPVAPAIANAARWQGSVGVLAWLVLGGALLAAAGAQLAPALAGIPDAKAEDAVPLAAAGDGVRALCGLVAAAGLAAAAGLFPAWLLLRGRVRVAEAVEAARIAAQQRSARAAAEPGAPAPDAPASGAPLFSGGDDPRPAIEAEEARLRRLAGWQALAGAPLALAAAAAAMWWWPRAGGAGGGLGLGLAAIALGFPVLVCERRFALAPAAALPEGPALARLLRLLLWTLVGGGVCALARALGLGVALWGQWILAGLVAAVAAELTLRALAAPFLPAARDGGRALGDSLVAGLALARLDPAQGLGGGLKERFGIDLSQSWALAFVRRAAPPLLVALVALGWLLSGVTVLGTAERGVYERLGAPVAVLPPGLHAHLPWPFGVVRRVENGPVHELAIIIDEAAGTPDQQPGTAALPPGADADAGAEYDRLWDRMHPTEATYLVPALGIGGARAPGGDGAQGVQVLNSDVRVFYRVGPGDRAAFDALYRVESPAATVRAAAGRLLVGQYAARTLLQVIGADRDALGAAFRAALQRELDALGSGLDITAVAIDSIHPPTQAAASYHGVQAAEISALTEIASARSGAAKTIAEAEQDAVLTRDLGASSAAELVGKARGDAIRFDAEVGAFRSAGPALTLERRLRALASGLSRGQVTIIDHRLQLSEGPVLDLRRTAPPLDRTR